MLKISLFLLSTILIVHVVGSLLAWYDVIWWLDIVMHFAGGAWVALTSLYFYISIWKIFPPQTKFLPVLVVTLASVALIGVLWEFYEYLMDVYKFKLHPLNFAPNPQALPDTLVDLVNDLLGGLLVVILYFISSKRQNRSTPYQNSDS